MTNSIKEIAGADFILAIGTNTTESHPIIGLQIKKALQQGATLVVLDPRQTEVAQLAHHHLRLKSGTDVALLNGLAQIIINEELWHQEFVGQRTEDFGALKQIVEKYTPAYVAEITGISEETLQAVARGYAQAQRATILYTMGLTQHTTGTHNVLAVANLALLCGHLGREHSGVNPLRGQNNVQGSCDMGALPNVLTGYQNVSDNQVRAKFAKAWGVSDLPASPGLTVGEMFEAAGAGSIKGMYIMGENPLLSDANANQVKADLQKLEFLVVQDIFLTETAKLADVVLPAASFAEKDGTFTNTERRVQRVRQAIAPVGQAKADWQIISLLAQTLGYPMQYGSPSEIMAEIAGLTPSYGGISYERLEQQSLQWPCPSPEHPGTPILHQQSFPRGRGKFHPVVYVPAAEIPDVEYPLVLSTGRRLYHYHTGTMTLRTGTLEKHYPSEYLEINPQDAAPLGLVDGEQVKVISRRGKVELAVRITEVTPPGLVFTSFHYPQVPINQLTNATHDPIAKIPQLKICAVRLEKITK